MNEEVKVQYYGEGQVEDPETDLKKVLIGFLFLTTWLFMVLWIYELVR